MSDPVTTDAKTPLIPRKSYNYQNSTREATTNHSSAGVLGTGSSWAEATNVSHVTSGTPTSTTVLTSGKSPIPFYLLRRQSYLNPY